MVSQLTRQQEQILRHWTLAMGRFVDEDDEAPVPRNMEDINTFQLAMLTCFRFGGLGTGRGLHSACS